MKISFIDIPSHYFRWTQNKFIFRDKKCRALRRVRPFLIQEILAHMPRVALLEALLLLILSSLLLSFYYYYRFIIIIIIMTTIIIIIIIIISF